MKTPLGVIYYTHLAEKYFFGFDAARMAGPEKAFLDMVYIRMRHGTFEPSEVFYRELLNEKKLKELAKRFPKYIANAIYSKVRKELPQPGLHTKSK